MKCPKCGSDKLRVTDVVKTPENEIYRQKECRDCKHLFYTAEFEVEPNDRFRSEWARYYRRKH